MKNIDLAALIDKYMAAETSLEEEKLLKNQLLSEENSKIYPDLALLFEFFSAQKVVVPIPEFKDPSVSPLLQRGKTNTSSFRMRSWIAAAASILILVFAYVYLTPSGPPSAEDTFTDPEMAARSAAEA